jgi:hypothetical protein
VISGSEYARRESLRNVIDEPITASELEADWRDAVLAADLAEPLTDAAAAAVEQAKANAIAEVSRLADETAAAAVRAAMKAKAAYRRATDASDGS